MRDEVDFAGAMAAEVLNLPALPVDVVATVGHQIDPSELGHLPSNVRVELFVPLVDVLADDQRRTISLRDDRRRRGWVDSQPDRRLGTRPLRL